MPRTGITEEQVHIAIQALQERGVPISKNTVRRELGDTGSFATIQAYLQTWRQTQATQAPPVVEATIPESVQSHFAKIWSLAMAAAQVDLAPRREALEQEAASLKTVIAMAQAENDEALRTLEAQIDNLADHLSEATTKETAAQARVAELAEALGFHKAKLESLEAQSRDALADRDSRIAHLEAQVASSTPGCNLSRRWVRRRPTAPATESEG